MSSWDYICVDQYIEKMRLNLVLTHSNFKIISFAAMKYINLEFRFTQTMTFELGPKANRLDANALVG